MNYKIFLALITSLGIYVLHSMEKPSSVPSMPKIYIGSLFNKTNRTLDVHKVIIYDHNRLPSPKKYITQIDKQHKEELNWRVNIESKSHLETIEIVDNNNQAFFFELKMWYSAESKMLKVSLYKKNENLMELFKTIDIPLVSSPRSSTVKNIFVDILLNGDNLSQSKLEFRREK